jgi:hypothetical protein
MSRDTCERCPELRHPLRHHLVRTGQPRDGRPARDRELLGWAVRGASWDCRAPRRPGALSWALRSRGSSSLVSPSVPPCPSRARGLRIGGWPRWTRPASWRIRRWSASRWDRRPGGVRIPGCAARVARPDGPDEDGHRRVVPTVSGRGTFGPLSGRSPQTTWWTAPGPGECGHGRSCAHGVGGLLFCALRLASGSLVAPLIVHTATNSAAIGAAYVVLHGA